jgi:hypothetical protein
VRRLTKYAPKAWARATSTPADVGIAVAPPAQVSTRRLEMPCGMTEVVQACSRRDGDNQGMRHCQLCQVLRQLRLASWQSTVRQAGRAVAARRTVLGKPALAANTTLPATITHTRSACVCSADYDLVWRLGGERTCRRQSERLAPAASGMCPVKMAFEG